MAQRYPLANEINTIIRETGTELTAGTAVKLLNELSPVLSKEIEFLAEPVYTFYNFASIKTDLRVTAGNEIKMLTYGNLQVPKPLQEGERIKSQSLASSVKKITVVEQGSAVRMTEAAIRFSFADELEIAIHQLARNYVQTLEINLRDVAVKGGAGTSKIYGRQKGGAKISARNEIEAGVNELTVTAIKDAVEILNTHNAPKIDGQYYVCICSPHQARALRDDEHWINASNYGAPDQLFTGECGMIEDVRFIVTTLMPSGGVGEKDYGYVADLKGAGKNSIDVYQAVVMGEDYYALAVSLPPEIRSEKADLGRELTVGWYGIWGAEVLNPTHGVVIETA